MKNILKPLAKNILIPPGLTVVASAVDTAIHKKSSKWDDSISNLK